MSKRSRACEIQQKVRDKVLERDEWCILCGAPGIPNSHYIPRSDLGLGIEENIVVMCQSCHDQLHHGDATGMMEEIKKHLDKIYPDFPDEMRRYNKWRR